MADNLPAQPDHSNGANLPSTRHTRTDEPTARAGWLGEILPKVANGLW